MNFFINTNRNFCEEIFKKICPNGAVGCSNHSSKCAEDYRIFNNLNGVSLLLSDDNGDLWANMETGAFLIEGMSEFGRLMYERGNYYAKDVYEYPYPNVCYKIGEKFENLFQK